MTEKQSKLALISKALTTYSVASSLYREGKARWDEKYTYTATVSQESFIFDMIMEWLNEETSTKRIKFVSRENGVKRHYDGTSAAVILVDGYPIKVNIEREDSKSTIVLDGDYSNWGKASIIFSTKHAEAIDALHEKFEEMTVTRTKRVRSVAFRIPSTYGWESRGTFPFRALESVFLPEGVKEGLIEDFDTFLSNEDDYTRIGTPYHRGYLLHGAPGNGKSSLVSALAHEYKFDVYNLSLSSVKDDEKLQGLIASIPPKSILLLEDIDIFSKTMGRTQAADSPTLAGLLNALDGIATPHGLITFMTTNHVETLDPALIRPGRVDYSIELDSPVDSQVESMFKYVYDENLGVKPRKFDSVAQVTNIFKMNLGDAEAARLEIKNG